MQSEQAVKLTTGVAGLPVVTNAREKLVGIYTQILSKVQGMGESTLRNTIEEESINRLHVVERYEDVRDIEKAIGKGQVEELIEQATMELEGLDELIESKVWVSDDDKLSSTPILFHQ